ncbi:hypothetical protein SAMN05444401_3560 [Clostridium amylolyticum]|uniref:Uncharacterized protein n=1 Tax=Clostridium amylolyticum TaxID=1121298 RepID=A0A1M6L0G7_9CLOT|nr:hypothetical protein [Clostridium amylolyticum]SHJ64626.1 hypothetical protein SAMN05444401_3560 [Clostridium amylolyticum]
MEQMNKELISKIEKALNIKFYEWQRKYLLNEAMLLDMRMTGRCTGKTLAHIIKQLFESSEPLLLRNKDEILDKADWWCCEIRKDRALRNPYLEWYKHELKGIYEELNEAGIVTREVIYKEEAIKFEPIEMDCLVCTLNKESSCVDCCRDWDNEE